MKTKIETISRQDFLAGLVTVNTIQSITWHRRCEKVVKCCDNCGAETATHDGSQFCNECNDFVPTSPCVAAEAGDLVRMQFIRRINREGTKNWTPSGGHLFNAPTQEAVEAIKRQKGIFQCLKFSEQVPDDADAGELARLVNAGDLPAVPRCFRVNDIETWTAEGRTYRIVD